MKRGVGALAECVGVFLLQSQWLQLWQRRWRRLQRAQIHTMFDRRYFHCTSARRNVVGHVANDACTNKVLYNCICLVGHVFVAVWNANALSQHLFVSIKAYIRRPKCWPFFSHILQHNDDVIYKEGGGAKGWQWGRILACCLCVCIRFVCMPYFSRPFDAGSGKDACLWRRHKSKRIYTSMFVQIVKVPIPLNGVYVLCVVVLVQYNIEWMAQRT